MRIMNKIRNLMNLRSVAVYGALVAFALTLATPFDSLAVGGAQPAPGNEELGFQNSLRTWDEICGMNVADKEEEQLKIFHVTVTCFETVIDGLAEDNIQKFSDYIRDTVYIIMMLSVIFFGAKVLTGMSAGEKLKSDFLLLLIKIGFVSWLVFNMGLLEMWQLTLQVYNHALELVITPSAIPECPMENVDVESVWITMDCLISAIVGFSQENGFGTEWKGVSLLSIIMGAKLFESYSGGFVFIILGNAIVSIIMAFARMAFMYILSMVGLILLFTVAPLIVPAMLFERTKPIFDNWYKLIISLIMQVVIMFAFFAFSSTLIHQLIFDEGGIQDLYKRMEFSNQVAQTNDSGSRSFFDQFLSATSVDSDGNVTDETKDLIFSMVSVMVLGWLILSFMKSLGSMSRELAGSPKAPELSGSAPGVMNPSKMAF